MTIRIDSSSLVPPSRATPRRLIRNSNIDLVIPRIHTPSVYFFRRTADNDSSFFCSHRLRRSLSDALVAFYPMAGRLRPRNDRGRVDIDCNANGVLFVQATALEGCSMDDFRDGDYFTPTLRMRRLIPNVDHIPLDDLPLLILQVTFFGCGGVALGVGVQHHVADGIASLAFINYWAKLNASPDSASIVPPQPLPFFDRSLLNARDPPTPIFDHVEYQPPPSLLLPSFTASESPLRSHHHRHSFSSASEKPRFPPPQTEAYWKQEEEEVVALAPPLASPLTSSTEIASDLFVFTGEQLERLKRIASAGGSEDPATIAEGTEARKGHLTSYEVLSAHVWRCVCAARGLAGEQESKLYIATDGRRRLRPPLPEGYFGNAIFTATPMRKVGEITGARGLGETAMAIKAALERMKDDYLRSAIDYLEGQPSLAALARGAHTFRSPNLGITSWVRLPTYDANFGWGAPVWMGPAGVPFEGLAYLLPPPPAPPSSAASKMMLLSITLSPPDMQLFRKLLYHFLI